MGTFNDLSKAILDAALEEIEVAVVSRRCQRVLATEGFSGVRRVVREEKARRMRDQVRRLERRGLIRIRQRGHALILALTSTGLEKVLRQRIKSATSVTTRRGTLVSYDIPEHVKKSREVLRRFLSSAGFRKVHASLWISEADVYDLLQDWVAVSDFGKWITVFKVDPR